MRCWCGYLSEARCRLFAYGPADAAVIPKPHNLLLHLNLHHWFTFLVPAYPACPGKRPFNGPSSENTQVSRYQKGKTSLGFTETTESEWQWHQLGHMQVCTSLQTDNTASTPPLSFYRSDALPAAQPTASKH